MSAATERPTLPVHVVQHVLDFFGDSNLGLKPGTFVERLLATISAADTENRGKLAQVFPEYVHAFVVVQQEPWGLDWLRGIAKAELDHAEQGLDFEAARS